MPIDSSSLRISGSPLVLPPPASSSRRPIVLRPTSPSGVSPFFPWKARTVASVSLPKTPSGLPDFVEIGISCPASIMPCWIAATPLPFAPREIGGALSYAASRSDCPA